MLMNYNVYIPSKGRAGRCLTVDLCKRYNIPYKLFVESKEVEEYANVYGSEHVVDIEGDDFGCVTFARNYIKEYSKRNGEERHWQADDDITDIYRYNPEEHINSVTNARDALEHIESIVDKYSNLYLAGISTSNFLKTKKKEYTLNTLPYCFFCVDNNMPYTWEAFLPTDIDIALQVLTGGDCTMRFNLYNFPFIKSNTKKGGYTNIRTKDYVRERVYKTFEKWKPLIPKIVDKGNLGCRLYMNSVWSKFKKNELKENINNGE